MGLIVLQRRRGIVLIVGLDRPDKLNALDEAVAGELDAALVDARRDPCIVVIHSTMPGVFAAGADIAELIRTRRRRGPASDLAGLFDRLEAHRSPTIAAVDGPALGGGCELALACDLRLASPRARFGQPELGLGILAGAGANWRLPQAVGMPIARRMLYAGEILDAEAARTAGLVDAIHQPEQLLEAAVSLGERVAARSWRALELTKLALRLHRPATTAYDITAQALLFEGEDKRVRMRRFLRDREQRRRARGVGPGG